MLELETRKKLRELDDKIGLFGDYACFDDDEDFCTGKFCEECEHFLPAPTLEELIKAIEFKVDKWEEGAYQIDYGMDTNTNAKYYSVFLYKKVKTSNMQIANSLDECLATALIWLYEEEGVKC